MVVAIVAVGLEEHCFSARGYSTAAYAQFKKMMLHSYLCYLRDFLCKRKLNEITTNSSPMAERPRELGDFKKGGSI